MKAPHILAGPEETAQTFTFVTTKFYVSYGGLDVYDYPKDRFKPRKYKTPTILEFFAPTNITKYTQCTCPTRPINQPPCWPDFVPSCDFENNRRVILKIPGPRFEGIRVLIKSYYIIDIDGKYYCFEKELAPPTFPKRIHIPKYVAPWEWGWQDNRRSLLPVREGQYDSRYLRYNRDWLQGSGGWMHGGHTDGPLGLGEGQTEIGTPTFPKDLEKIIGHEIDPKIEGRLMRTAAPIRQIIKICEYCGKELLLGPHDRSNKKYHDHCEIQAQSRAFRMKRKKAATLGGILLYEEEKASSLGRGLRHGFPWPRHVKDCICFPVRVYQGGELFWAWECIKHHRLFFDSDFSMIQAD